MITRTIVEKKRVRANQIRRRKMTLQAEIRKKTVSKQKRRSLLCMTKRLLRSSRKMKRTK